MQWHRHRTWSYNEESGRYSVLSNDIYAVDEDMWRKQSTDNKQGSGDYIKNWPEDLSVGNNVVYTSEGDEFAVGNWTVGEFLSSREEDLQDFARDIYEERLKLGVAREQARTVLPLAQYSTMFATVNLHNLLHFLNLRSDLDAQLEIRQYANIIAALVKTKFPLVYEAWIDYQWGSIRFSRLENYLLKRHGCTIYAYDPRANEIEDVNRTAKAIGMTDREIREFWQKINKSTFLEELEKEFVLPEPINE